MLLLRSARGGGATAVAALYLAALLVAFGISAAYHRVSLTCRWRAGMQRLDHCAIYVLILGTYVPVCMLALPPPFGIPLLSIVGAAVVVGIVLKFRPFGRSQLIGHVLYIVTGWAAIAVAPAMWHRFGPFCFIVAGGLAYSVGFPVLLRRRPDPWPTTLGYHEIWHGFTVAGAGLHFAAVAMLVR